MGFSWTLGYGGFVGVIAFLAVVVGGPYLLEKFFKIPILSAVQRFPVVGRLINPAFAGILGIALIALVALPYVAPDTAKSIGSDTTPITGEDTPSTDTVIVSATCNRPSGGNTASLLLAIENADNPADSYLASVVNVVKSDGTIDQTGNTNAGTALSYVTLAVTPCQTGTVYILGNSTRTVAYDSNEPQRSITHDGSLTTTLNIDVLNFNTGTSILANGSIPSSGVCPTEATAAATCGEDATSTGGRANTSVIVTNQTLGSGGSANIKYTLVANTANARYGTYDDADSTKQGVIFSAYITDLSAMSAAKGLTLGGLDGGISLSEITCPSDITANRRANKCYASNTLKSGFTYTGSATLNCDLGDCATQDYVDFCIDDLQWVKDTDQVFKKVAFLLDGTNVGSAGTCARFFLN